MLVRLNLLPHEGQYINFIIPLFSLTNAFFLQMCAIPHKAFLWQIRHRTWRSLCARFYITWRGICDVPEPLVLAPGEGMYAKAADRRCRERFSASEPISGRKARATIIRRASIASDVCLSSRTHDGFQA